MRKAEFIQKYLGNANYQFTDENRELMYDDLCRVVDYDRALMESYRIEYEKMKDEYSVKITEEVPPVSPCCAYEQRVDGSRCWNCGDPPKKGPLPKDFIKLKYMHVPSKNQNSDFSL
jgi:hypothetical protein